MKKAVRVLAMLAVVGSIGLGAAALLSAPARADVENPCDPTYNMLKNCKAQHGHWDNSCCCCRLH
jgi:hypothetical protein